MPKICTARFQIALAQNAIDADAGVIRGVKVMEVSRVATFAGEDGKPKQATITGKHIAALLAHAGNRAIPSHWSHDWFDSKADPINFRVGMLKNFSTDSDGNLVGDLHLAPGKHRKTALWTAANAPENVAMSPVFDYDKSDKTCLPLNFQACDIVAKGAATTALLADATEPNKSMDVNELITALQDPAVLAAIKAIVKSVEAAQPDDTDATAMEADAGVTDEDKKDTDSGSPALMSAVRINRATARKIKSVAFDKTALMAEIKVITEAAVAGKVGSKAFLSQFKEEVNGGGQLPFVALMSQHETVCKDRGKAILRAKADNPTAYNAWEKAGRPMPHAA